MEVEKLKKRTEFQALSRSGKSIVTPSFIFLWQKEKADAVRIGFTASKKIGGAVQRNRAKRRLRAIFDDMVRLNENFACDSGLTINLIARKVALDRPYDKMKDDLKRILQEEVKCRV